MGEIRLPGLATGIDTSTLIQQLMIINSRRLARYQVKKLDYEREDQALTDLKTNISSLESAASALSDASKLETFKSSTSDKEYLTLEASSEANPGSHSVDINQLAAGETWIHDTSTFTHETDYVGGGTFIFSYNNQECVITAVEDVTTLEDFVNLINNNEDNPGVTASLLYQGGKYHLMLSGQETGEDYQISINSATTEVLLADSKFTKSEDGTNAALTTKITELVQFTKNGGLQGDETIGISGDNHFGTALPIGYTLSVTANTTVGHLIDAINEYYDGVATATLDNGKIVLTDHISGDSTISMALTYDDGTGDTELTLPTMSVSTAGGTAATLSSFSSGFIQTQNAQNSEIRIDNYPSTDSIEAEEQRLTLDAVATNGHFHLTYKGEITDEILYDATTAEIQTALNGLSTVTLGDITVGGDRLDQVGVGYTSFTFLDTAGDVEMLSIDTSSLTGPSTSTFAEHTQGNNGWIHRNSNTVNDAITGVTLYLHDVTTESIEITLTRNTTAVRSKVQAMITAYNDLVDFLEEKTEYNADTKEMGILSTNMAVSLIESQMKAFFSGVIDGFADTEDTFITAADIGITVKGDGRLELDTNDFDEAIGEDFNAVLELLGATKSGNSDSTVIGFYGASDAYTTAGIYDVQVEIEEGTLLIIDAKIKLESESTYRENPTWGTDLVYGNSDFDENGKPLYPENSLQLSVDRVGGGAGVHTAKVRVKQGLAGGLEDLLDEILDSAGRIEISKDILQDRITSMESTIEDEEDRLEAIESRLVAKFARMEKMLSLLQEQYATISILGSLLNNQ